MNRVEIRTEDVGDGIHVVRVTGKLDVFSYATLKDFLQSHWAMLQGARVVVDLSEVSYIASSGWSVMLSRRRMLKLVGGDLVICGLNADCKRVYDAMKIMTLLPSADDLDGAVKILSSGVPAGDGKGSGVL